MTNIWYWNTIYLYQYQSPSSGERKEGTELNYRDIRLVVEGDGHFDSTVMFYIGIISFNTFVTLFSYIYI